MSSHAKIEEAVRGVCDFERLGYSYDPLTRIYVVYKTSDCLAPCPLPYAFQEQTYMSPGGERNVYYDIFDHFWEISAKPLGEARVRPITPNWVTPTIRGEK